MEKEKLKILIVDDNEKDLKLLELKLIQLGFNNIIKAKDGQEALKLAWRHLPDLICLDLMMPELDGGQVKERLKEDHKTKNIPTIVLSSIITKDEQKNMQYLKGGDIIIAKPYSSDELLEAIDRSLGGF
ncbi:MAG: response regulator [Desulfobacterales bacterium]